MMTNQPII